jgi:hypothetical protein
LALCLVTAFIGMPADLGLQAGRKKQTILQALRGFDFKGSALLTISTTFLILGLVSFLALFPPVLFNSQASLARCSWYYHSCLDITR